MDSLHSTIVKIVTNKWVVIVFVVIATILALGQVTKEHFDPLINTIDLPTGIYTLANEFGTVSSDSFHSTPLVTSNLLTQQGSSSPFSNKWAFKRVTDGVYLIRKPRANLQGAECLYSSTDHTVRGYIVSDPDICGMDTLNDKNQLDPYSIRLYFKLSDAEDGTVVIQSLQNNMYLTFDGTQLSLSPILDESGYFIIRS
jgi:hypothetical protein